MKRNNLKIKYIIGTYRDEPDYPTKEDIFAMADEWYHLEGGKAFIHDYRGLGREKDTIFTNNLIKEKGLPKKTYELLGKLIECGDVVIIKETKHTIYHLINKR